MKHIKSTLAALAAAVALAPVAGQAQQQFLTMSSLPPGTSNYLIMSSIAQIVGDELDDVSIQLNAAGTATQNMLYGARGDFTYFMQATNTYEFLRTKSAMFKDVPNAEELAAQTRSLFAFPGGSYHIVVNADSDIYKLEDLKGKAAFFGPPGGGATAIMTQTFEAGAGLVADEDYKLIQVGWDAGLQAFQDGRADVYANFTVAPSPVIQQLALTKKVRLLDMAEYLDLPAMQPIVTRPGSYVSTLDPAVYNGQIANTEPLKMFAGTQIVATSTNIDDETVYRTTKAFWEAVKAGLDNYPWMQGVQLETAFDYLNIPLHPGAVRYYEEIGLEIPEDLRPAS